MCVCVMCVSVYVFHLYNKPTWHTLFYSGTYFTMLLEMSNLSFSKNRTYPSELVSWDPGNPTHCTILPLCSLGTLVLLCHSLLHLLPVLPLPGINSFTQSFIHSTNISSATNYCLLGSEDR